MQLTECQGGRGYISDVTAYKAYCLGSSVQAFYFSAMSVCNLHKTLRLRQLHLWKSLGGSGTFIKQKLAI